MKQRRDPSGRFLPRYGDKELSIISRTTEVLAEGLPRVDAKARVRIKDYLVNYFDSKDWDFQAKNLNKKGARL